MCRRWLTNSAGPRSAGLFDRTSKAGAPAEIAKTCAQPAVQGRRVGCHPGRPPETAWRPDPGRGKGLAPGRYRGWASGAVTKAGMRPALRPANRIAAKIGTGGGSPVTITAAGTACAAMLAPRPVPDPAQTWQAEARHGSRHPGQDRSADAGRSCGQPGVTEGPARRPTAEFARTPCCGRDGLVCNLLISRGFFWPAVARMRQGSASVPQSGFEPKTPSLRMKCSTS